MMLFAQLSRQIGKARRLPIRAPRFYQRLHATHPKPGGDAEASVRWASESSIVPATWEKSDAER